MRKSLSILALAVLQTVAASAACCYFAAVDKDVKQPGQRAFISWDAEQKQEAFTVQPQFKGNAEEFGMVIPTPSRPKLQEMPRDFFKELAIFTILEPMDPGKFQCPTLSRKKSADNAGAVPSAAPVRVLEAGVVGNLDYKILEADKADALFEWLKSNHYSYSGDKETLQYYVSKKWNFTVMKIDPRQMKRQPDGKFSGDITPTRFTFATDKAIYPLRITQISVADSTDVLLYVMSKTKMDMDGGWSYEANFLNLWTTAMQWAVPEKVTPEEKRWQKALGGKPYQPNYQGAQLEWAGKLTRERLGVLTGKTHYNRQAPPEEIKKLKLLSGHLREGYFLTKFRKRFAKSEMTHDIGLVPARINGMADDLEYVSIMPTSPP